MSWPGCVGCALLVGLSACDQPKPTPPLASAPSQPRTGLYAGDAPVTPKAVLATGTEGESAWRVTIATVDVDCAALTASYPERPDPARGELIDLWLAEPWASDGKPQPWTVRGAYLADAFGGRGLVARGAMVDKVTVGDTLQLGGVELALQDRKKGGRLWQYSGALEAKRCPRVPRKEKDRPQPKLKLSIAGHPFAIHGASVHPQGKKHFLRLTRAPHDCPTAFTEGYDFFLDVALAGDPPKVELAALQGDLFPETPAGSKGKESFEVTAKGQLGGSGEVTIALKGTLHLTGYQVELDGSVEALGCTPVSKE